MKNYTKPFNRWKLIRLPILQLFILLIISTFSTSLYGQDTPVNFKVAFIGDSGTSANAKAVLNLIQSEGADVVVHSGDMTYSNNPAAFEAHVNSILGANYPYFWSAGNHDSPTWNGSNGFQVLGEARMNRLGIPWTGQLGVSSSFTYQGIFFVASAPSELGVSTTAAGNHIRNSLAGNDAVWSIAYWHKNQTLMQIGGKGNEAGWSVYEESRKGGAIAATGHEHSYSRTHEMSNMQNQGFTTPPANNTITLKKDDVATSAIDEGRTFAFVNGLGGQGIRVAQSGRQNNPWWASTYYNGNGGQFAALFGEFNYNGDATLARFYYKDIDGVVVDEFFVRSEVEAPQVCSTPITPTNLVSSAIEHTTATISWNSVPLVDGYDVRHRIVGASTWINANTIGTNAILNGLTANTTYEVQVSSVCSAGTNSAYSASHNFTTLPTPDTIPPTIPENLVSSNITETSVDLSWTASTDNVGVTGYDVLSGATIVGTSASTTFNLTGLSQNTTYALSVRAKDAGGNVSGNSNEVSVTTLSDTQAPTAPTNLVASNVTDSGASLSWTASTDNVDVSDYDVYRGTSIIATVIGTTHQVSGLAANTNYDFTVVAKDAVGNQSAASNVVSITTDNVAVTYCTSASTNVNDEYIGRVQLNTIDNSSGAQFYSDFTSLSTTLVKGSQYTITVTPTWTGTIYNEGYSVWIDYNRNGDFTDAGEQVWTQAVTSTTPVSGNFTVPVGAIENSTRMRVALKYNGIPTSCESFQYGEVEDYTIVLQASVPDTTAPTAPTNLVASNVTDSGAGLSWTASTDNVGVSGYDVYQSTSIIATVTGTTYQVSGLTANTNYDFTVVAKDAAGNVSAASNVVSVTTDTVAITYCASASRNVNDEFIGRVQLNTIDNSSGAQFYSDFTSLSTTLVKGSQYTIIITPTWTGTIYNEGYSVWIDYNKNGDFTDTGEQVWTQAVTSTTPVSGSFIVPVGAIENSTRMRVALKYNGIPTSCESFQYGEVEDYTVNIGSGALARNNSIRIDKALTNEAPTYDFTMYPNPVEDGILHIKLADARNASFTIINYLGQTALTGKVSDGAINVSKLSNGVYILKVDDTQRSINKRFIKE